MQLTVTDVINTYMYICCPLNGASSDRFPVRCPGPQLVLERWQLSREN